MFLRKRRQQATSIKNIVVTTSQLHFLPLLDFFPYQISSLLSLKTEHECSSTLCDETLPFSYDNGYDRRGTKKGCLKIGLAKLTKRLNRRLNLYTNQVVTFFGKKHFNWGHCRCSDLSTRDMLQKPLENFFLQLLSFHWAK